MSVGAVNKQTGDRIPTAGMPAIDDALDLTSVNPVQNAIVTAALANKQDKTDNNLNTADKTTTGAINELKSGLINVQGDVKLNTQDLTTPSRTKNILPITIDVIKSGNTTGTWTDNAYTINGITYTFNTNADGQITDITASGTASANADLKLLSSFTLTKQCILTGCPANGSSNRWYIGIQSYGSDNGNGLTVDANTYGQLYIRVASGITITTPMQFYPMLRYATITDPTFAPYIPSVESRIEAVDFGILPNAVNYLPSVTIDVCQLWKNGKVVNGNIKFTTSETIASGNYIISGLPKISTSAANGVAMGAVSFNKNGAFGGLANTQDGTYGAVFVTAELAAGTYCASFSYISA